MKVQQLEIRLVVLAVELILWKRLVEMRFESDEEWLVSVFRGRLV